jgi:hypothetical protein
MKKIAFLHIFLTCCLYSVVGQTFSIGADQNNILYLGIDNPLTIAAENISRKMLIVKTDNGVISGENGIYVFRGSQIGKTTIILYKKVNGKLKEIGRNYFRIKNIPDPTFKIGSGRDTMRNTELASQLYVRAELENFEIDGTFQIISFTVCIISSDTCKYKELKNISNKISSEIRDEFQLLKNNDAVVFKSITGKRFDGSVFALRPIVIVIKD